MLTIEKGKSYRSRDGRKVFILTTERKINPDPSNPGGLNVVDAPVVGLVDNNLYEKMDSWYLNGSYFRPEKQKEDVLDLIEEWIDPVYKYYPVLMCGPLPKGYDTPEEAIEAAGNISSLSNGLVGYLRIDTVSGKTDFAKPGEQFN